MKLETVLFAALGAGLGYVVLKQVANPKAPLASSVKIPAKEFPALTTGGKLLTPRQAMQGAYLIGYSDGKGGRVPIADVVAMMQSIA